VTLRVLVESGDKRVFATALDWPGLTRGAKTREDALAALVEYAPRYKKSIGSGASALKVPASAADLEIVAQASGDKNIDFGVPHSIVEPDQDALTDAQLDAQVKLLRAAWKAFEKAVAGAQGKTLASGARGGGRTLAKIKAHVPDADAAYISALGAKAPRSADWAEVQDALIEALHAKVRGELPETGPRGGARWPARYAIRRSAWHALDHAWEIDDRST
jgi:hypothetical protein